METVRTVLQIIAALGLLNVWTVRFGKATPYRGGNARTMREEFAAYGLPFWMMWAVGALKMSVALALLLGIWVPALVQPAALTLVVLMVGALAMHVKVKDPILKSVPALAMLSVATAISLL